MKGSADGGGCFPTGRHYPGIAHLLRVDVAGLVAEHSSDGRWLDLPIVSIDTETTGRDPDTDRIVEVACVQYRGGTILEARSWLVNPGRPIPREAFDVHGIGDDTVAGQPPFAAVAAEVLAVCGDAIPLAYNAEFDRRFLRSELDRLSVSVPDAALARAGVDWLDPLVWARELQANERSRALGDVCGRLGIALEQAHRATCDAEAALRVLLAFAHDSRVPERYGALVQEQRRLARLQDERSRFWRSRS
ncbi:MAG: 3'-5' exonuclease [Polyangiaceae bacterium]|nr:3'-5' exonuclease [Polyangiaceae bacterium]